jgi:hypothetical protein
MKTTFRDVENPSNLFTRRSALGSSVTSPHARPYSTEEFVAFADRIRTRVARSISRRQPTG